MDVHLSNKLAALSLAVTDAALAAMVEAAQVLRKAA